MVILNEEEKLECKVRVDVRKLDHVSEFIYFGCVLDGSGTDEWEVGCRYN